jgi:hypothetical protein
MKAQRVVNVIKLDFKEWGCDMLKEGEIPC